MQLLRFLAMLNVLLSYSLCFCIIPKFPKPGVQIRSDSPQEFSQVPATFKRSVNETKYYRILPRDPLDTDTNLNILRTLKATTGRNGSSISQFGTFNSVGGVILWQARLNRAMVATIREASGVAFVDIMPWSPLESLDVRRRDVNFPAVSDESTQSAPTEGNNMNVISQPGARDEMAFISTYPATDSNLEFSLGDYCRNFNYDASAGKGVTVYVVGEEDATLDNEEFVHLRGDSGSSFGNKKRIEWLGRIYGLLDPDTELDQPLAPWSATTPTLHFHGAAVLSKVVGVKYGTAKDAKIVFVRAPKNAWAQLSARLTLWAVRQHWSTRKGENDVAIVTTSVFAPKIDAPDEEDMYMMNMWRNELNSAVSEGLLPLCSAGTLQKNATREVVQYPALFAGETNWNLNGPPLQPAAVPKLIPVGYVYNSGLLGRDSPSSPIVKQFGPGLNIKIPGIRGQPPVDVLGRGTSFATPAVAGVAAYFASLNSIRNDWDERRLDRGERLNELYDLMTEPATKKNGKIIARARWPRNYQLNDFNYPHAIWNRMDRKGYLRFCPSPVE